MITARTENSERKQGGRFRPGQSGNPAGKPKGARHKTTLLAEKLMQDDAEAIVKAVLDSAKSGGMTAARIVLDRIAPARRDNPVSFELPKIESADDAAKAMASLVESVAAGEVTPGEAVEVCKVVDTFIRTLEMTEPEARLRVLEERTTR